MRFSRLISDHQELDEEIVIAAVYADLNINAITCNLPVSYEVIRSETDKDELLQSVIRFTSSSWPDLQTLRNSSTSPELEIFHRNRNVLTVEKGCLMFADRVVIPSTLRVRILKTLHRGHPGISRMKSLARGFVY